MYLYFMDYVLQFYSLSLDSCLQDLVGKRSLLVLLLTLLFLYHIILPKIIIETYFTILVKPTNMNKITL